MARTFHAQRAENETGRVSRTARLRAAEQIADELDALAQRRQQQHAAEMAQHASRTEQGR